MSKANAHSPLQPLSPPPPPNPPHSQRVDSREHDVSRPPVDKARLRELYVSEDHTQADIADHFDVAQGTIGNWLREYGITKATRLPADD